LTYKEIEEILDFLEKIERKNSLKIKRRFLLVKGAIAKKAKESIKTFNIKILNM